MILFMRRAKKKKIKKYGHSPATDGVLLMQMMVESDGHVHLLKNKLINEAKKEENGRQELRSWKKKSFMRIRIIIHICAINCVC